MSPTAVLRKKQAPTIQGEGYGMNTFIIDVDVNVSNITQAIKNGGYYSSVDYEGNKVFTKLEVDELTKLKRIKQIVKETGQWQNEYRQCSTGRLYGVGETLQSMPKTLRSVILNEYTVLDFNSACYTVFLEIYRWICMELKSIPKQVPHIEKYVNNPQKNRRVIATDILNSYWKRNKVIDEKTKKIKHMAQPLSKNTKIYQNVKSALTALGFGARTSNSYWFDQFGELKVNAIKEHLGALTEDFYEHPFVKPFIDEYKFIMQYIFNALYSEGEHEIYPGVSLDDERLGTGSKYARIYQSLERRLLDCIIDSIDSDQIQCLLHDGVLLKPQSDISYIKLEVMRNIKNHFKIKTTYNSEFLIGTEKITMSHEHKRMYDYSDVTKFEDHLNHLDSEEQMAIANDYIIQVDIVGQINSAITSCIKNKRYEADDFDLLDYIMELLFYIPDPARFAQGYMDEMKAPLESLKLSQLKDLYTQAEIEERYMFSILQEADDESDK